MSDADLSNLIPEMLPRLWAFALRLTGDQHDAEDLVQRGCLRALERAHQLQPGTAPLSWMFSIVHSTWLNELRARNLRRQSSFEWDQNFLENVADPAGNDPETQLMHAQIIGAIERLPEVQRVVMLLVAVEGMTYREAADVLDVPMGTVMSRLSRARQAVGSMIGEDADLQSTRLQKDSLA
ncbi:RNA polymerase sigma factor [Paraburkholderia sp. Tr-20389]|uniref:RNA polymerase sigma factor n=1 Tax=Paraburkholderia sp. Tr-20389 TaxID=2703903 RepID=UPI00197D5626|nr:RNA polymerase sigma factor [Paraburkholderia sp. Tr-20389]MBN3751551.1 RNA polymerase sigma factor [Paraburkholderia sp. Tr-20389]